MRISLHLRGNACADGGFIFGALATSLVAPECKDINEIIPLLHTLRRPTFFTRDHGFYRPTFVHPNYCLVHLEIAADETAEYIRRFLRHSDFRTQAQRIGKAIRVHYSAINYWQVNVRGEDAVPW